MKTATTKKNLFGELIALAEVTHRLHRVHEDCESCHGEGRIYEHEDAEWRKCLDCIGTGRGELCFNLFTFMEDLANKLEDQFHGVNSSLGHAIGRFELDAMQVARLLYCHMCLTSGDSPDGTTFRGLPILD